MRKEPTLNSITGAQRHDWWTPAKRIFSGLVRTNNKPLGDPAEQVVYDTWWNSSAELHEVTRHKPILWPQNSGEGNGRTFRGAGR